jgi:serine/threonine protein kinase/tetratricopeptide (TPR) repeat protein
MIGKTISHYKILEKLGEGGMGMVYKAGDTKLDRVVALKFLSKDLLFDEEAKTRFVHEAKAASALDHPNIATIYEIDEAEGECFISMAYIEGKSIQELIKERKIEGWDMGKIIDVGIQIAEGLSKAHQKGIVHRDIKSDNLMLTNEGLVKIMDFGLAKLKGITKLTQTGSTLGTVAYMSPEQAQGIEVDQRSDIFSFGVVLYEMITGQLPFKGEHEAAVIYSIVNETSEPLARYKANVPEGLQRIVDKALKKDLSTRYQSAVDVIADLKGLQKETTVGVLARPKKKLFPFLVPASIVFIILLLFLILKPFKVEVVPKKRAIAEENSLAIMYFENMVDPEDKDRIAQMITALLITDLSESQYMRVVSRQRLYDILKLLGKEDLKVIDRTVASEVAKKAGVKWIMTGNVFQIEPNMVLTSDISDATTGEILATQKISGEEGEDLFSVVDKLSVQIKDDLSLPEQAKSEPGKPIADVTTHSSEAYRYYLEGLDYGYKFYYVEAEKSFRKALEFDSTFAMAYYRLATLRGDEKLLAKAVEYSDKVSQKERFYIKTREAAAARDDERYLEGLRQIAKYYPEDKEVFLWLGSYYQEEQQFEEAVRYYNKAIEIDPLYKLVYNMLAYVYYYIEDFDKSILAINKYISLAPDEANPYDTRADLYAYNGKIDQAIESYKKALKIKPDFYASLGKLGHSYLFKREYAKAESCYKELSCSTDKDTRSGGRTCLALIPLYQGKLEEALEVLDDGIAADRMEQSEGRQNADKHVLKGDVYEEKKNLHLALKEVEKGVEIRHRAYPDAVVNNRHCYVRLLAENNNFVKAEQVAEALKKDIEEKDHTLMYSYRYAVGCIEFSRGSFEVSAKHFTRAAEDVTGRSTVIYFQAHFMLARAYLDLGRLGEAVAEFEKLLLNHSFGRVYSTIWSVKTHYYLGLAYEKSGWNKKAIEQYEEFLEIWKDADPGIPEVEDAKERLKRLRIES